MNLTELRLKHLARLPRPAMVDTLWALTASPDSQHIQIGAKSL